MINFLTEKEPKMKFFDFEAFQKIRKILSREKYIFHMLFGAFHSHKMFKTFHILE